jgi:outer membrane receptor protein involved in Fe transport
MQLSMQRWFKQSVFTAIIIFCSNVFANDEDVFELTLQQLMQVEVVSGISESISLTPGTVSSYYPDQLKKIGLHSLSHIINFATNTQVSHTQRGNEVIQVRGLSDPYNQKVLLLLDGIPYWMPSHGEVPLYGIPIDAIERVEMIRGPASVIYGTNSSAAVINVISKQKGSEGHISLAEHEHINAGFHHVQKIPSGSASFSMQVQSEDGYEGRDFNTLGAFDGACFCFPSVDETKSKNQLQYTSALSRIVFKGVQLTLQAHEKNSKGITSSSHLSPGKQMYNGYLASLRYEQTWADTNIEYFSDWNRFYWDQEIAGIISPFGIPGDGSIRFDNDGEKNVRWLSGVRIRHAVNDRLELLLGLEYEERQIENHKFADNMGGDVLALLAQPPLNQPFEFQSDGSILLIEADKVVESSAYIQGDYKADAWRYVLGFRHVDNGRSGTYFAPRLSVVHSMSNHESIKLLYGEGFNSPTFRQLSGRDQFGMKQVSNVEAEVVRTYEVAYLYANDKYQNTLTGYYTEAGKLILNSPSGFKNSENVIKRYGLEYETRYLFSSGQVLASLSYLKQGNEIIENDANALDASAWLARIGAYKTMARHTIGMSLKASSERAEFDAQYGINMNYEYQVNKFNWYVTLNNVLSEDIYDPEIGANTTGTQSQDSASALMGVEFAF